MTNAKKKVLITSPSFENLSGISTIVSTIILNSEDKYRYVHFRLGKLDNTSKRLAWFKDQVMLLPKLLWTILKNDVDIIHLNAPMEKPAVIRDFFVFLLSKFVLRRKILFHIHGGVLLMKQPSPTSIFSYFIKKMLQSADTVVILSELEGETIYNHYRVKGIVLSNAVDRITIYPAGKNFHGKLTFVFLGRIVKSKGIFVIAEAFKNLKEYFKDFEFHIYGVGPDLDSFIQSLSAIEGLNFAYRGVVRDEQKRKVFEGAHIFLLPSINGEGLPLAMLEAMASGCIPLVSNDASMPQVIKNNVNGFTVEAGNELHLRKTIADIINNRDHLLAKSTSAYATVLQKHDIKTYLHKLQVLYDDLNGLS